MAHTLESLDRQQLVAAKAVLQGFAASPKYYICPYLTATGLDGAIDWPTGRAIRQEIAIAIHPTPLDSTITSYLERFHRDWIDESLCDSEYLAARVRLYFAAMLALKCDRLINQLGQQEET